MLHEESDAHDDGQEYDASDSVTCCAVSCAAMAPGQSPDDVCFFGTKSGDVISLIVRDEHRASEASPGSKQRRRSSVSASSPSMKAAMTAALFATQFSPKASGGSAHSNGVSSAAAAGIFRVMVCQRPISVIAASGR